MAVDIYLLPSLSLSLPPPFLPLFLIPHIVALLSYSLIPYSDKNLSFNDFLTLTQYLMCNTATACDCVCVSLSLFFFLSFTSFFPFLCIHRNCRGEEKSMNCTFLQVFDANFLPRCLFKQIFQVWNKFIRIIP